MAIQRVFLVALLAAKGGTFALRTHSTNPTQLPAVDAKYDGQCFYPQPALDFDLDSYLGRWYQVAGTVAPFTAGCKCIRADYSLNANGTVDVLNGCELGGQEVKIQGTATAIPSSAGYGEGGVLRVQFPGQSAPECPGPNYVVQYIGAGNGSEGCGADASGDGAFAIVQSSNFSTLFLLSRQQNPSNTSIEAWLQRAGRLGSNLTEVVLTDQTGCQFT
ncbi:hypothetical protein M409DRAFT_28110 [Zasmidium cellare ATCC 36951]|uniref:Lipocalin/cytosolic fatty-acid binding domain-containing protein n=1 Tax=Zasmidium cellare ATCC 36951 TaxID=1080233 RepID=A0A6A6C300_ZASCE|nr:uncharacterized protein M409DRAFT_28110 [Zasmidium cellare ATCC 36951]KAF2161375.1 hypothetical protein M409DRAFT_28110 [Zasmidium cellare ATCC 36951]